MEAVVDPDIAELNSGLGRLDRMRLSAVLRGTKGTVTNDEAATITGLGRIASSKMLARWHQKGWLSRVRRGLYVPVDMESTWRDSVFEHPWLVADRLYSPCYIGGFNAGSYWDFTDQIFLTIAVMSVKRPRNRNSKFRTSKYWIRTISPRRMFGLETIWCGSEKVRISDPSRTILDMLSCPPVGGGIRSTQDMLRDYLDSDLKDLDLLLDYAERFGNGAVFKRLGFLLETNAPHETDAIERCRANMTKGYAHIELGMRSEAVVARWRLLVPREWKESIWG